jgi:hypothetical protein
MPDKSDITVTLPIEHFNALSAVISTGLKHAVIKPQERKQLEAWWQAESTLIQEELEELGGLS